MALLFPYLHFEGNCLEAMTFYKSCIKGELTVQTFGDTPMKEKIPDILHPMVMHSKLQLSHRFILMASDYTEDNEKQYNGNLYNLCVHCTTNDEIEHFYKSLSMGGEISKPLQSTFWGGKLASFSDKFGKKWILHFDIK